MARGRGISLSFEDGARAVELARESVEGYVRDGRREQTGSMRDSFYERTGTFVRIERDGRLRGCAGSPESDRHLGEAIVEAAIRAASTGATRGEVSAAELSELTVGVFVVSEVVLTDDPLSDLSVGTHGVAVDAGGEHAWLYPAIPAEQGWSPQEYLRRTCRTAGLDGDAWRQDDAMVTLLEGDLFSERSPCGEVVASN
jgi:uncharacterized protein (TIGR00296 family)